VVLRPRLAVHCHSLVDRVCDLLRVPGVHDDAAVQALRRARKLGEHESALPRLLARDVLVADEVHAVTR
jgi:hypothetical protein